MLAKGLCFNCNEPGHLARNCPKTNNVSSKIKGKPPGMSTYSVRETQPSDGSVSDSVPSLQSVSESSSESSDEDPPDLQAVSDSSDSGSDITTHVGNYGAPDETFEDRLGLWAHATESIGAPRNLEGLTRERRLGDVLGNTVAALLEFFQPYPGDERISWSDDRRDAKRFRVSGPFNSSYTIEDTFSDQVVVLDLEALRCPHFHLLDWFARKRAEALEL
ncbi:hypothetical protein C8R44DRAFT_652063, partial [Mycena epipterygia]